MEENQTVWKIRYVNPDSDKLLSMVIFTSENSIEELFEELGQFSEAKIISIRNETEKEKRKKKKEVISKIFSENGTLNQKGFWYAFIEDYGKNCVGIVILKSEKNSDFSKHKQVIAKSDSYQELLQFINKYTEVELKIAQNSALL